MNQYQHYALLSVWDKTGISELARKLVDKGFSLLGSVGTSRFLEEQGIPILSLKQVTGFSSLASGRVKTLHHRILERILANDVEEIEEWDGLPIGRIEVVVCNLYPYSERRKEELSQQVEYIDIGGTTLLRSAAKNFENVVVLSSPNDYLEFLERLEQGELAYEYRLRQAVKAFAYVNRTDAMILEDLANNAKLEFPEMFPLPSLFHSRLRYGENPHQDSGLYLFPNSKPFFVQLHGKPVSYNNLLDLTQGLRLVSQFEEPACAIMKHTNPCGFGVASSIEDAFSHAFDTDQLSAFGSIMVFNRPISLPLAEKLHAMFVDGILAPGYDAEAFNLLSKKKKLMLLQLAETSFELPAFEISMIPNGFIVQRTNTPELSRENLSFVSERPPTEEELNDLLFAWKICRWVKSNAAVVSKGTEVYGITGGATSRIDAVRQSVNKAGERAKGAVLASDAFFPFRDSVDYASEHGITAILAPGGSIRDPESIQAANEHGIALVFSKIRGFKH